MQCALLARNGPAPGPCGPPTGPGPPLQLVRSRFAGFSKMDPFHSLTVGRLFVRCSTSSLSHSCKDETGNQNRKPFRTQAVSLPSQHTFTHHGAHSCRRNRRRHGGSRVYRLPHRRYVAQQRLPCQGGCALPPWAVRLPPAHLWPPSPLTAPLRRAGVRPQCGRPRAVRLPQGDAGVSDRVTTQAPRPPSLLHGCLF